MSNVVVTQHSAATEDQRDGRGRGTRSGPQRNADGLRPEDRLTVIGQGPRYHVVPSNPWVAIGWREPEDIEVNLDEVMRRKGAVRPREAWCPQDQGEGLRKSAP